LREFVFCVSVLVKQNVVGKKKTTL